ncbi:hypothetical protein ACFL35_00935 [Candidatus Riflebacteria bacterium]
MLASGTQINSAEGKVYRIDQLPDKLDFLSGIGWGKMSSSALNKDSVRVDKYSGKLVTIKLETGPELRLTPDHMVYAKFEVDVPYNFIYLTQRIGKGFRVDHIKGLTREIRQNNLIFKSDLGEKEPYIEKYWILKTAKKILDAEYLVTCISLHYGIPTHPFTNKRNRRCLQTKHLDRLFAEIDTEKGAIALLKELNLFYKYPHFTVKCRGERDFTSQVVSLTIFGALQKEEDSKTYPHLITVNNARDANKKKYAAYYVKKSPSDYWDLEVTRQDIEEAQMFVRTLTALDDLNINTRIKLTESSPFYQIPASHIKEGMLMPILGTHSVEEKLVIDVKMEEYRAFVYNFDAEFENFIANGVFVSNHSCKS